MPADACILDGYVDEPACLGVPPYISPYIRTVAGALIGHGFTVRYLTIDQLPERPAHYQPAGPCEPAGHDRGCNRTRKISWWYPGNPQ